LPGPEATELACYLGLTARGRVGAIVAGLGFCLPGFTILMAISWFYTSYGLANDVVRNSLRTMQLTVSAMIIRACFKLSEACLIDGETRAFSWLLGSYALLALLLTAMRINFLLSLFLTGLLHTLMTSAASPPSKHAAAGGLLVAVFAAYAAYVSAYGPPPGISFGAAGVSAGPTLWGIIAYIYIYIYIYIITRGCNCLYIYNNSGFYCFACI
jgi:chromate transporter